MKRLLNLIFPDRLSVSQLDIFMYFPGEKLILATREHWLPLGIRLFKQLTLTFFLSVFSCTLAYFLFRSPSLSVMMGSLIILGGMGLLIREIVHWNFHLYIVTDHKLLEIRYDPLFSEETNSVLLDQIRCTEIDAEMHGVISELLNIGNVSITFDRPTHQEIFRLKNIRSPRKIAALLSGRLHRNHEAQNQNSIWYRERESKKFRYIEGVQYGVSAIN